MHSSSQRGMQEDSLDEDAFMAMAYDQMIPNSQHPAKNDTASQSVAESQGTLQDLQQSTHKKQILFP